MRAVLFLKANIKRRLHGQVLCQQDMKVQSSYTILNNLEKFGKRREGIGLRQGIKKVVVTVRRSSYTCVTSCALLGLDSKAKALIGWKVGPLLNRAHGESNRSQSRVSFVADCIGTGALRLPTPDANVSHLVVTETALLLWLKELELLAFKFSSVSTKLWIRRTCT
uniref:Uncharacterized protein n=1 Tax=Salix viminalis TaxID=40686 RepID=A0A6N2LUE5_SALVM